MSRISPNIGSGYTPIEVGRVLKTVHQMRLPREGYTRTQPSDRQNLRIAAKAAVLFERAREVEIRLKLATSMSNIDRRHVHLHISTSTKCGEYLRARLPVCCVTAPRFPRLRLSAQTLGLFLIHQNTSNLPSLTVTSRYPHPCRGPMSPLKPCVHGYCTSLESEGPWRVICC